MRSGKSICTYPGCHRKTSGGRCSDHKENPRKEQSTDQLYQSNAWKKISKRKRQYDPFCEKCLERDIVVDARITDHIVPLKEGGALLDWNNLQSLCMTCHNQKTANER
jgi:5-methylcytosine-specific restriction protein A